MINTMENTINDLSVTKSLKLLRDGFKNELATFIFADERTTQLFAELISEFVEANIWSINKNSNTWSLCSKMTYSNLSKIKTKFRTKGNVYWKLWCPKI
jgi:hypothetical protein